MLNTVQSKHLDLIRGIAAQLVLLHHAFGFFLPGSGLNEARLGFLGVLVFFLLSGFLITGTICARVEVGRYSLVEFSVSRFSRIYTPYVPAILLVAVLDHFAIRSPSYEYSATYTFGTAVANLFMLQDFPVFQILRRLHVPEQPWFFKSFGSAGQFWTVSIEWWIYVTAGFGTYLALRGRKPSLPALALLFVLSIEPLYHFVGGPGNSLTTAWLCGSAANLGYRRWVRARERDAQGWSGSLLAPVWFVALALAGARLFFNGFRVYDPIFAFLLGGVLFIPLAFYAGEGRQPWFFHLDKLSFHSYSLYLTHASILVCLSALWGERLVGWGPLLLIVAGCNMFAVAFACLFEAPHKHVRAAILAWVGRAQRRWLPRKLAS